MRRRDLKGGILLPQQEQPAFKGLFQRNRNDVRMLVAGERQMGAKIERLETI